MRPETCGVHRSLTVRIVGATTTHPQVQPRLTSRGRAGLPYAETATDYRHVSTAHDGPSAVAAAHLCAHPALCALAHGCCGVAKQISAKGSRSPQEQQHGLTHVSGRHTHIAGQHRPMLSPTLASHHGPARHRRGSQRKSPRQVNVLQGWRQEVLQRAAVPPERFRAEEREGGRTAEAEVCLRPLRSAIKPIGRYLIKPIGRYLPPLQQRRHAVND